MENVLRESAGPRWPDAYDESWTSSGPRGGETVKNERIYRTSTEMDGWCRMGDCDSIGVMNQVVIGPGSRGIAVRDGRRLGFAEFGSPHGPAIIWMHGTPGARRQIPVEARAYADREGLRIIGVDRPGIGSSTPHVYESVLDWTEDPRDGGGHPRHRQDAPDRSVRGGALRPRRRRRDARPGARGGRDGGWRRRRVWTRPLEGWSLSPHTSRRS